MNSRCTGQIGNCCFIGVVLAGEFTIGSLNQLKSLDFGVLYFPYDSVVKLFEKFGVNAASDEKTPEIEFRHKLDDWNQLINKEGVAKELMRLNRKNVKEFFVSLSKSVSRFIEQVVILPLHGQKYSVENIAEAIEFIGEYS